jgi:hypothetical protein
MCPFCNAMVTANLKPEGFKIYPHHPVGMVFKSEAYHEHTEA